ncbi:MAG: ABC transporter ATP-binding protein [Mycoplasmataceae bacterium]|nr:ABC transporter ATP-binding protein [Mycoplasmataceae bacterium]
MEQKTYEILEKKSFKDKYVEPFKFLWKYIKVYKFLFIFVVVGMLFVSLINCGVSIGQYFFTKYISDTLVGKNKTDSTNQTVLIFMICLVVAVLVSTILYAFQTIFMTKIAQYSSKYLRKDLYFKILDLKLKFFDSNPSGDIMSRLTNDVNNITIALTQNVVQFIVNFSQIFFFLIALLVFSPIMGSISLCFIPIQLSVIILFFKKAQPNFFKKQILLGEINGYVEETISGQKVINNFNKQEFVIKNFKNKNDQITNISYKANLFSNLSNPWNTLMANMLVVTLFIVGMVLSLNNVEFGTSYLPTIQNNPENTLLYGKSDPALVLSLLTAIMNFARNFTNPIYQIFQILNLLQMALAGAERTEQIKKQEIEIRNEETIDVSNLKGNIDFKNLTFSYDGFNNVLKNINLSIKQGQVVGIVGPTGSGKTTIINLLTKFYDVTNENSDILIDGVSIKNITKHSLRNEVSIVLQDTFIFEDTIYENMRYANPEATNEEIEEAAKKSNAHSFIMSLEKGYDTVLKNNADEISQGQRQLLAITRAFLRQSSILILDEATSSIDTKTEKDIQTGMIKLSQGKTTFMIAHRLSTIKHADIIIVLKDGQILEKGNHFELLEQNGFYANMYNSKLNTPEDI